jgi:hypothetical protein
MNKINKTMKRLLLLIPILFTSCYNYEYVVEYEKCNGKKDTIKYVSFTDPCIKNHDRAKPELYLYNNSNHVLDVCDYRILSKYKVLK